MWIGTRLLSARMRWGFEPRLCWASVWEAIQRSRLREMVVECWELAPRGPWSLSAVLSPFICSGSDRCLSAGNSSLRRLDVGGVRFSIPPLGSCFDKNCVEQVAPNGVQGNYRNLTHDELHHQRRRRSYASKDSEAALKKRLTPMDAMERNRARDMWRPWTRRMNQPKFAGNVAARMLFTWLFFRVRKW